MKNMRLLAFRCIKRTVHHQSTQKTDQMTNDQIQKLISYCKPTQEVLKAILTGELQTRGKETIVNDGFLYSPGTHPILLIAHLDTVHEEPRGMPTDINIDYSDSPGGVLSCTEGIGGDDRAGVYIIMEIIKSIDCHVLFCEDEEKHGIGAEKFCETDVRPDVQFIVEFDRRDRDHAVFYNCHNKDFCDFVTSFGFNKKTGSFSDISVIAKHLEIAAVNLSSGYYNAHNPNEYIVLDDIDSIIERAIPLIADVSKKYEYVEHHY